jgi:pyridoxal phosphate enzyme (YggS family)
MNDSIRQRLERVVRRIRTAAEACSRDPDGITLVTVSKTVPADRVRLAIAAGVNTLGENYVQEARDKIQMLSDTDVSWHFIGHLQSNKAKYAVKLFDMIHSVDSLKLATEIDKHARKAGTIQPVLVQVNLGNEPSKFGLAEDTVMATVRDIGKLANVRVRGLMTMPPFFNAPEKVRPFFAALRRLRDRIRAEDMAGVAMDELSMGMTGDFETAIQEGATLVRIGTAIFGERS